MRLKFHPEAEFEAEDTIRYYNSEEQGLGSRFLDNLNRALQEISTAPVRWPFLEKPVRRRLIKTFPYGVLYSIESDFILIIAIMHCHREPGYWRYRLPLS